MSIRYSPGCPCCEIDYLAIAAGVYCARYIVINNPSYNPAYLNSQRYILKPKIYFPPQTISLWKLGDSTGVNFQSNEQLLDTFNINTEIELDYTNEFANYLANPSSTDYSSPCILPYYMSLSSYIDPDGNLKTTDINSSINQLCSVYGDAYSSLKNWPPAFLYHADDKVVDAWYKLVFDLRSYGSVYKQFYVPANRNVYAQRYYYSLAPENFPNQLPPENVSGTISGNQNLTYRCCSPCIIQYQQDMIVNLEFTGIDTNSWSYDFCQYSYAYYPYNPNQQTVLAHKLLEFVNPLTNLSVRCKWNNTSSTIVYPNLDKTKSWISDPIVLYTQKATITYPNSTDYCITTTKYKMIVAISCGVSTAQTTSNNSTPSYYKIVGVTQQEISQEYSGSPLYSFYLCNPDYNGSLTQCNLSGSCSNKTYGNFVTYLKDVTCSPFSGQLIEVLPTMNDGCTAGVRGSVTNG